MRQRRSDAQSVADVEEQKGTLPMSHTPEPWKVVPGINHYGAAITAGDTIIAEVYAPSGYAIPRVREMDEQNANAAHIVACVNGCAGLNPAAYRECVEVLQNLCGAVSHMEGFSHHGAVVVAMKGARRALARATGGQPVGEDIVRKLNQTP